MPSPTRWQRISPALPPYATHALPLTGLGLAAHAYSTCSSSLKVAPPSVHVAGALPRPDVPCSQTDNDSLRKMQVLGKGSAMDFPGQLPGASYSCFYSCLEMIVGQ